MTKITCTKLLTCFLLASFFSISKLSFAIDDNNQNIFSNATVQSKTEATALENHEQKDSKETEAKPGIISKIQDLKKINVKKTASKTFYYSVGATSATISAASICGLIYLFIKINEIKKSYIKNFIVGIAAQIALYFENKTQYKQYMIPVAIVGLSANAALTAVMAAWMFRAGYKA